MLKSPTVARARCRLPTWVGRYPGTYVLLRKTKGSRGGRATAALQPLCKQWIRQGPPGAGLEICMFNRGALVQPSRPPPTQLTAAESILSFRGGLACLVARYRWQLSRGAFLMCGPPLALLDEDWPCPLFLGKKP